MARLKPRPFKTPHLSKALQLVKARLLKPL
jgi:hypothetical protein